jgi:hypothetical protein
VVEAETVDGQQSQNMNQVAEQDTDSARQSFQLLADRTVALQESNLRLTQSFFQRMSGITLEGKLYISEQEREGLLKGRRPGVVF